MHIIYWNIEREVFVYIIHICIYCIYLYSIYAHIKIYICIQYTHIHIIYTSIYNIYEFYICLHIFILYIYCQVSVDKSFFSDGEYIQEINQYHGIWESPKMCSVQSEVSSLNKYLVTQAWWIGVVCSPQFRRYFGKWGQRFLTFEKHGLQVLLISSNQTLSTFPHRNCMFFFPLRCSIMFFYNN